MEEANESDGGNTAPPDTNGLPNHDPANIAANKAMIANAASHRLELVVSLNFTINFLPEQQEKAAANEQLL